MMSSRHRPRPSKGRGNNKQMRDEELRTNRIHIDAELTGDTHHCADKMSYMTLGAAKAAARASAKTYMHEMGVYRCPVCGLFHLTHRVYDRGSMGELIWSVDPPAPLMPECQRHLSDVERVRWLTDRHLMTVDEAARQLHLDIGKVRKEMRYWA